MLNIKNYLPITVLIIFIIFSVPTINCAEEEQSKPVLSDVSSKEKTEIAQDKETSKINLRSSHMELPVTQAQEIPNIEIRKWKKWGFYGSSTINKDYKVETINDDKVVINITTGLMWHQSGSKGHMNWEKAKLWVDALNSKGYAGHNDWRLPTEEEVVSLLEPDKKDGIYIDRIFDKIQLFVWTGDSYLSHSAWIVSFRTGLVTWCEVKYRNYIRPVRTMK